ncbi:MAG TPA: HDOD domain-containing protein [Burkholderiaceae bacterium]|jgi:EAL and modified HD-GYP domain-containing signal transduction protein
MFEKLFRRQGKSDPDGKAGGDTLAAVDGFDESARFDDDIDAPDGDSDIDDAPLTEATALSLTFICRAPVVDRTQRVIGYEFMLRDNSAQNERLADPVSRQLDEQALLTRLAALDLARLLAHRYTFLTLSAQVLLRPAVEQLPPELTVLSIRADSFGASVDPNIAARMAHLRRLGFGFALLINHQTFHLVDQLHHLTHYVVLDLTENDAGILLKAAVKGMQRWPETQLYIKHIADVATFDLCNTMLAKHIGIHLFQGSFLTQALPWRSDHVDTGKARIVRLLNAIKQHYDIPILAESLRHDPLLLSRLLRYANSAASSPLSKVNSAERALAMMGRENVYRMLTVLLFCSGNMSDRDVAIMDTALIRGRFAETLGTGHLSSADCDNLFLVGMFSLLDILLRVPPDEALLPLELPAPVLDALLARTGPYACYLDMVTACEHGDQERIVLYAAQCDVSETTVNACHLEAILWAQELARV